MVEGSYATWKVEGLVDQTRNYSIHVCNWRTGQMISVRIVFIGPLPGVTRI